MWGWKPWTLPILLIQTCTTTPRVYWQETCLAGLFSYHRRTSLHSTYRDFSTHHCLSRLMHLWRWITALVGSTKAAGCYCCQKWQAESPYSGPDNGGLRWYGIVCQHYLWLRSVFLGLCEEVLCHHTRFNFLWSPQTTKKLKKQLFSAGSWEDEREQSARDHRVTAVCEALRGFKGKSNLKHESPTFLLWSTAIMMIFLPVIWEFWNMNNSFKKQQTTERGLSLVTSFRDKSCSCSTENKHTDCTHSNLTHCCTLQFPLLTTLCAVFSFCRNKACKLNWRLIFNQLESFAIDKGIKTAYVVLWNNSILHVFYGWVWCVRLVLAL